MNTYNNATETVADQLPKVQADLTELATAASGKLPKSGGTMTGDILLNADGSVAMHPVTKQQLDAVNASAVHVTSDETIAGVKTLSSIPILPASNPTTANEATRKSYVDAMAISILFNDNKVAGTAAGNAAAAMTEWSETAAVGAAVVKIRSAFTKQTGHKYLRLKAAAKASTSAGWGVILRSSSANTSATGVNTSYGGTPEVNLTLDISGLTTGTRYEVTVELYAGSGATANLKDALVQVEPG
jgi:hypothetical protein